MQARENIRWTIKTQLHKQKQIKNNCATPAKEGNNEK